MLSKTRSTPGRSPAPGVIPDPITGPNSNGSSVATTNGSSVATTANRKTPAPAHAVLDPASKKFVIFEDNGGSYHWTIIAGGETLVQSPSFATYEDAKQAARVVHAGACSASFEDSSGDTPPDDLPAAHDPATARDALDAERRLDEGGSFSSEAMAR
jgi:uncharacterized protein YegP (UPF0339 family)